MNTKIKMMCLILLLTSNVIGQRVLLVPGAQTTALSTKQVQTVHVTGDVASLVQKRMTVSAEEIRWLKVFTKKDDLVQRVKNNESKLARELRLLFAAKQPSVLAVVAENEFDSVVIQLLVDTKGMHEVVVYSAAECPAWVAPLVDASAQAADASWSLAKKLGVTALVGGISTALYAGVNAVMNFSFLSEEEDFFDLGTEEARQERQKAAAKRRADEEADAMRIAEEARRAEGVMGDAVPGGAGRRLEGVGAALATPIGDDWITQAFGEVDETMRVKIFEQSQMSYLSRSLSEIEKRVARDIKTILQTTQFYNFIKMALDLEGAPEREACEWLKTKISYLDLIKGIDFELIDWGEFFLGSLKESTVDFLARFQKNMRIAKACGDTDSFPIYQSVCFKQFLVELEKLKIVDRCEALRVCLIGVEEVKGFCETRDKVYPLTYYGIQKQSFLPFNYYLSMVSSGSMCVKDQFPNVLEGFANLDKVKV